MISAGVLCGSISHARTRASISAVLFVTLDVPYAAGRGWTRERIGMVGRCIQFRDGVELLMAVMVTLATAYTDVVGWGWCGGVYVWDRRGFEGSIDSKDEWGVVPLEDDCNVAIRD